jgi:site-specific DNA-methyltransferase (adenine-specific)
MNSKIIQGNNVDVLKTFPDNHFDSIVTDPPYGIDFLGKAWDANTGALETYQECLRVLKPGGHIVAFSAARTYHHLAVTIEQAGFEIRDQIMWIYSSGFPKSQDVGRSIERTINKAQGKKNTIAKVVDTTKNAGFGQTDHARVRAGEEWSTKETEVGQVACTHEESKAWQGWGTALKPAHEPIVMARKPIKLSIAKNCQQWGVGALNIDATRVPYEDQKDIDTYLNNKKGPMERSTALDGENLGMFEGKVGYKTIKREVSAEQDLPEAGRFPSNVLGEILQADYQKYFYCPKVSRRERHVGHATPPPMFGDMKGAYDTNGERYAVGLDARTDADKGNNHPTVKPIELMKYLIRLITPAGGHVLDPFNGSGSTGCAAVELDYAYTGIELDEKYVEIAEKRIAAWYAATHNGNFDQVFEIL